MTDKVANENTYEIRYQKALKEINKLIQANNEARNQIKVKENILQQMESQYNEMAQRLKETVLEKEELENKLINFTSKYQELDEDSIKKYPVSPLRVKKMVSVEERFGKEEEQTNIPSESGNQLRKKIQEYSDKNYEQIKKIEELERINQQKTQKSESLNQQNKELKVKILQISQKLQDFQHYKDSQNNSINEENLLHLSKENLIKRIVISNNWTQNVKEECSQLKAKIFQLERHRQLLSNKSQKHIPRIKSPISVRNGAGDLFGEKKENQRFAQFFRKAKKTQTEHKNLVKKYESAKEELEKNLALNHSQRKEIEKLKKQNEGFSQIIEKQEAEMKNLIEEYQMDIGKLTSQFKEKLEEQRMILGKGKMQKKLKELESLDNENKSLKKRLQIFNLELTKHLKLYNTEKEKNSKFQKYFKELAQQNHTLKEMIKNMNKPSTSLVIPKEEVKASRLEGSCVESEKLFSPKKSYRKQSYGGQPNINRNQI